MSVCEAAAAAPFLSTIDSGRGGSNLAAGGHGHGLVGLVKVDRERYLGDREIKNRREKRYGVAGAR